MPPFRRRTVMFVVGDTYCWLDLAVPILVTGALSMSLLIAFCTIQFAIQKSQRIPFPLPINHDKPVRSGPFRAFCLGKGTNHHRSQFQNRKLSEYLATTSRVEASESFGSPDIYITHWGLCQTPMADWSSKLVRAGPQPLNGPAVLNFRHHA